MSNFEKQKTNIELFSTDLNGWIQLNLVQFGKLIKPHINSFGEDNEFSLDSTGLRYKLYSKSMGILTFDQIKEGDFYEIKREENLSVKLSNWYDGGLKLDTLNSEIANYIEEWQDKNKTISHRFTLFTRCKVLLKNEDSNEVIIRLDDENIHVNEKISVDRIRLLSDEVINEYADSKYLFDSNHAGLKLKKISAEYLIRKFNLNEEVGNVNLNNSNFDLIEFLSNSNIDLNKVFYDYSECNKSEITIHSTHLNL
jgi:hypothetical protein